MRILSTEGLKVGGTRARERERADVCRPLQTFGCEVTSELKTFTRTSQTSDTTTPHDSDARRFQLKI